MQKYLGSGKKSGKGGRAAGLLLHFAVAIAVVIIGVSFDVFPAGLIGGAHRWHRLGERNLGDRQCVMNLFVDKHEANEFNPDYDATGKKIIDLPVEGTYRSKGQIEVINRFISSVAAAFRPNLSVQQHVVFAGTRDGGHLAEEALKHWPPRGSYRTQLHVLSSHDYDNTEGEYENLQDIEELFQDNNIGVKIYDSHGNLVSGEVEAQDDDTIDEELKKRQLYVQKHRTHRELPDLQQLIFEQDDEEDSVIPYLHVDGTSMADQMDILYKASNLLRDRKVVVVGLEHSPDMDVQELIDFFSTVKYKTFMLGLRQLTRIDNLCPEILQNVLQHPSLGTEGGSWFSSESQHRIRPPPFFIAMPRGRPCMEEMSIQHMYDLFSGASGLLQVKTANDRVASVK